LRVGIVVRWRRVHMRWLGVRRLLQCERLVRGSIE
jgi:hypothetical protein